MSKRGVLRIAEGGILLFWCPGCCEAHQVWVGEGPGPRWSFNGDYDKPTFTPSIRVDGTRRLTDEEHAIIMAGKPFEPVPMVCHSFVTNGQIQFLGDCTHAMAGQTVPLSPV